MTDPQTAPALQSIRELADAERQRLAEAYKLPYSEKGILVSNSYLRALADVEAALIRLSGQEPKDK